MKLDTALIKDFDTLDADGLRAAIAALDLPDGNEELKKLREEYQKKSSALDKTSSDLAEVKKQLKGKMSQDEADKAAREEEYNKLIQERDALKKENQLTKFKAKYLSLGYDEAAADKAANAQFSGDSDTLFSIMGEQNTKLEAKLKADLLKGTPRPEGAGGGSGKNDSPENVTLAKQFGEARANSMKAANDALKHFL